MCLGGRATEEDSKIIKTLFSAVGFCCVVDEKLLSAVTGLSGSGPAYVFVMIEAMADGGVKAGLPRVIAQQLAAQTVFGSAKMVLQTGKHPGQLKDRIYPLLGVYSICTTQQEGCYDYSFSFLIFVSVDAVKRWCSCRCYALQLLHLVSLIKHLTHTQLVQALTLQVHRLLVLELDVHRLARQGSRRHEASHIHIHRRSPLCLSAHLLGKLLHWAQLL